MYQLFQQWLIIQSHATCNIQMNNEETCLMME